MGGDRLDFVAVSSRVGGEGANYAKMLMTSFLNVPLL